MKKKLFYSILITVLMVIFMIPASALASETITITGIPDYVPGGDNTIDEDMVSIDNADYVIGEADWETGRLYVDDDGRLMQAKRLFITLWREDGAAFDGGDIELKLPEISGTPKIYYGELETEAEWSFTASYEDYGITGTDFAIYPLGNLDGKRWEEYGALDDEGNDSHTYTLSDGTQAATLWHYFYGYQEEKLFTVIPFAPDGEVSYRWYACNKDGVKTGSALSTSAALKISAASIGTRYFICEATDGMGNTSNLIYRIKDREEVRIIIKNVTYNGKSGRTPSIAVKSNGKTLVKDKDYKVKYAQSSSKRKGVGGYGVTVTLLNGNYSFVTYDGDDSMSISSKRTVGFSIVPKKASIKSLNAGTKKLTVNMSSKVSSKAGRYYQIAYKVKGAKNWKYTKTTSKTKTIKKLKKGKRYQVKVRAYKTVNGIKHYGAWSKVKTSKKIK